MSKSKIKEHPFFWNKIRGRFLEDLLLDYRNISEITFCSAYLSDYGVDLIEKMINNNKLLKKKVKVYISREFSNMNCHEILVRLSTIAEVKIYAPTENTMFHPKLILLKKADSSSEFIIGSSNLTCGGLSNNVEMNVFSKATDEDIKYLEQFMMMVDHKSQRVDNEIIDKYKKFQNELDDLNSLKKRMDRKYRKIFVEEKDPFEKDDFNLDNQYFKYEDYEVFFERNIEIMHVEHREVVREKLIELHEVVMNEINEKGLNLSPHWMENHITSLTTPQVFNRYMVEWMGVRYGKKKAELEKFWDEEGKSDFEGFQKHACLQFSINEDSFMTNLFHAVPKGAHDRYFVHEKINNKKYRESFISALETLKGMNATWYIGDEEFSFEYRDASEFIDFYKENDKEGVYSYLSISYDVDSDKISKQNIVDTILTDFERLYLLYKIVAKRY